MPLTVSKPKSQILATQVVPVWDPAPVSDPEPESSLHNRTFSGLMSLSMISGYFREWPSWISDHSG